MRRAVVGTLALVGLMNAPAQAQQSLLESCSASLPSTVPAAVSSELAPQFELLCAQVVNSVTDLQPSVGMTFSGGNPVLGTGSTLGTRLGLPRISVTARANATLVDLPDVFATGVGTLTDNAAALAALGTVGVPIGAVQGDVAVGLFDGISVAPMVGGIGAVDLLGSVAFVPAVEAIGLAKNIINAGVGARIGLLGQGLVAPGISVSGMYRRMGEVGFGDEATDPAYFSTNLSTLSLRAVASKGLAIFDLAVGAGYDQYSSDVSAGWSLECETTACTTANDGQPVVVPGSVEGQLNTAAWNVFANVGMSMLMVHLVGEVGYQKAMDRITADDLQGLNVTEDQLTAEELSGGRFFGSVGLRIAL